MRATASARVLVVDDEPLVARAIARALRSTCEVSVASSGCEALRRLETDSFDVVLCDLAMPGMSGIELHRAVRARAPAIADAFVFLTGGTTTDAAEDYLARTGLARVGKPFDTGALRALVAQRACSAAA